MPPAVADAVERHNREALALFVDYMRSYVAGLEGGGGGEDDQLPLSGVRLPAGPEAVLAVVSSGGAELWLLDCEGMWLLECVAMPQGACAVHASLTCTPPCAPPACRLACLRTGGQPARPAGLAARRIHRVLPLCGAVGAG